VSAGSCLIPSDPGIVQLARDLPALEQTVEMRHTFSRSHLQHSAGYGPAKQQAKHIAGGLRLHQRLEQPLQRLLVSLNERLDPRVQSVKRLVVRGQDENIDSALAAVWEG